MTNADQSNQQVTSQWIMSLAISVICCAILFVVFAGYIMDMNKATTLLSVRIEVMQEQQRQMAMAIDTLRHPAVVVQTNNNAAPPAAIPMAEPAPTEKTMPTPELTEKKAPAP